MACEADSVGPVERCLACEADSVGTLEPRRGAALERGMATAQFSSPDGCHQGAS